MWTWNEFIDSIIARIDQTQQWREHNLYHGCGDAQYMGLEAIKAMLNDMKEPVYTPKDE